MKLRAARVEDAVEICGMINYWAERSRMLHRSLESVYAALRSFQVVEEAGRLIGCVSVSIFWSDLAEVKSLAVAPEARGKGVGRLLVQAAIDDARRLGIKRLFALTYEQEFFLCMGFQTVDRHSLPDKVWRECFACPKADACDETAMILMIGSVDATTAKTPPVGKQD